jgi:hypothetical protein
VSEADPIFDEGWKGQLAGGTVGTLAGGALGAVGGPIGAAVGGALGGTAGQMIGDKLGGPEEEDELDNMRKNAGIHEDEQLNEFIGPAIAAGARLLMPLLSRVGPALGRMASTAGKAGAQAAGKGAQAAGQAAGQVARAGTEIAAKNAIPIGIGAGAYQAITDIADSMVGGVGQVYRDIGSAADAITKAVGSAIDEKTIVELAGAAVKYAIPIGILLAVLYGGKKLIDKALAEGLTDDGSAGAAAAPGPPAGGPGPGALGDRRSRGWGCGCRSGSFGSPPPPAAPGPAPSPAGRGRPGCCRAGSG